MKKSVILMMIILTSVIYSSCLTSNGLTSELKEKNVYDVSLDGKFKMIARSKIYNGSMKDDDNFYEGNRIRRDIYTQITDRGDRTGTLTKSDYMLIVDMNVKDK